MNPFINMEQHKEQFTQNELRIYETIIAAPEQVTYQSTNKLAEICGVSQPALTRFIKVLGYQRYQDFRSDVTTWLARQEKPDEPGRLTYFERLGRLIAETEQVLTDEYMNELADYLLSFRRIFTTGIGKSNNPARLLQYLCQKNGIFVLNAPLDVINAVSDNLEPSDLLIVFSVSAQGEIMEKVRLTNGKIIVITTNAQHKYQDAVDQTVVLPYLPPDPEMSSVSPVLFDILSPSGFR